MELHCLSSFARLWSCQPGFAAHSSVLCWESTFSSGLASPPCFKPPSSLNQPFQGFRTCGELAMTPQADRARRLWTLPQEQLTGKFHSCHAQFLEVCALCHPALSSPSAQWHRMSKVCGGDCHFTPFLPLLLYRACKMCLYLLSNWLGRDFPSPTPWSQEKDHMQPLPFVWFSAKTLRSKTVFCSEWSTPSALWT